MSLRDGRIEGRKNKKKNGYTSITYTFHEIKNWLQYEEATESFLWNCSKVSLWDFQLQDGREKKKKQTVEILQNNSDPTRHNLIP